MKYYKEKEDAIPIMDICEKLGGISKRTATRWIKGKRVRGSLFMVLFGDDRYRLCTTGRAWDKLRLEYRKFKRGRG